MSEDVQGAAAVPAEDNGKRKGFDIAIKKQELAVEDEGKTFHVRDADFEPAYDDDGNPVTWTICGINSKTWKRAERWQQKAIRDLKRKPTDDETDAFEAGFLARCSKGFTGFTNAGQKLPFSTDNATAAILGLPYLKRQIYAEMGDHAGFTKPASIS